jgi:hypothetical protein
MIGSLKPASGTVHGLNGGVYLLLNLFFHDKLLVSVNYNVQVRDGLSPAVDTGRALTLLEVAFDL